MLNDLVGKTVVITGAGSGIGRSFAHRFGREGGKIVASDLDQDRLDKTVGDLMRAGIEADGRICDVTDRTQVEALADFAWARFGTADVILNNAGIIARQSTVLDMARAEIDRVFEVNLFGMLNGTQVFGKRFAAREAPAAILNVGSENSFFNGIPGGSAYVATKHAILAFAEALREEVPNHIYTALICPGLVGTDLTPRTKALGMNVDAFTAMAMDQLRLGRFYIVSHAYNVVPIRARFDALSAAYAEFAPRYEGDIEFDVRDISRRGDR